ncbi:hypothetical protein HDV05_000282 [Chytridiales sp. JEL 0842]|nr:hypothetical protein HDV05_000282 [Chytridiales sp. JEL 0842]
MPATTDIPADAAALNMPMMDPLSSRMHMLAGDAAKAGGEKVHVSSSDIKDHYLHNQHNKHGTMHRSTSNMNHGSSDLLHATMPATNGSRRRRHNNNNSNNSNNNNNISKNSSSEYLSPSQRPNNPRKKRYPPSESPESSVVGSDVGSYSPIPSIEGDDLGLNEASHYHHHQHGEHEHSLQPHGSENGAQPFNPDIPLTVQQSPVASSSLLSPPQSTHQRHRTLSEGSQRPTTPLSKSKKALQHTVSEPTLKNAKSSFSSAVTFTSPFGSLSRKHSLPAAAFNKSKRVSSSSFSSSSSETSTNVFFDTKSQIEEDDQNLGAGNGMDFGRRPSTLSRKESQAQKRAASMGMLKQKVLRSISTNLETAAGSSENASGELGEARRSHTVLGIVPTLQQQQPSPTDTHPSLQQPTPQTPLSESIEMSKRSRDLRRLFPSMPATEMLIEDYICALQKSNGLVMVQGKLYVSTTRVSFYSNILGYVHKFSIEYPQIQSISKKKFAGMIPNAIQITSNSEQLEGIPGLEGGKLLFHGFLSPRDAIYQIIVRLWLSKTSRGGVVGSSMQANDGEGVENGRESPTTATTPTDSEPSQDQEIDSNIPVNAELPQSLDCPCTAAHNADTHLIDHTFPHTTLSTLWTLLCTPTSSSFLQTFLETNRKCTNVNIQPFPSTTPIPEKGSSRQVEYVIPLGVVSPLTKVTETIHYKTPTTVCVLSHSVTPDVYMGDAFRTNIRTCLTEGKSGTRLRVSYRVEFFKNVGWIVERSVVTMMKPKVVEFHEALRVELVKEIEKMGAEGRRRDSKLERRVVEVEKAKGVVEGEKRRGEVREGNNVSTILVAPTTTTTKATTIPTWTTTNALLLLIAVMLVILVCALVLVYVEMKALKHAVEILKQSDSVGKVAAATGEL